MPDEANRSPDDWLQLGINAEMNGELLIAENAYEKALQKFPNSFELLKASGRLLASLMRYERAAGDLEMVHARRTTDGEVTYYLGISYDALGREGEATNAYEEAMRLPAYRAAAAMRLGELQARQGALAAAEKNLAISLAAAPQDLRAAEELSAVMRVQGKTQDANKLAAEWLARNPLSDFLNEEIAKPQLEHLAADPYRVLNVAFEYARLGLYRQAVNVLSRKYPAVNADQSEPGAVLPQNHPMVAYFRGYCRDKLGQSGASDYAEAARLKSTYVFPDSEEEFSALTAALKQNEKDANARALLGDWYFARGESDLALSEWNRARINNPSLPIVDASMGLALLRMRGDYAGALEAFEQGIENDPRNIINYQGAVAATTLLGKPPSERVKILQRYPDFEGLPTNLVFELALSRAEASDYDGATKMFNNRFFGREEGGTNVREVWIEVKLSQALELSRRGHCDGAVQMVGDLGKPITGPAFTENGLESILQSARTSYLLGELLSSCGQKAEAEQRYEKASRSTELSEIVWAWAAARKRPGFDGETWRKRLESSLTQAEARIRTSSFKGWWTYNVAILQIALGQTEQGRNSLRSAILLPESLMSYHYSRQALAGATPGN